MGGSLASGRSWSLLYVLDGGIREPPASVADPSLPSTRAGDFFEDLVARDGALRQLRCDNGPEFITEALRALCEARGIALAFIESGHPNQNAYVERFERSFRD